MTSSQLYLGEVTSGLVTNAEYLRSVRVAISHVIRCV